MAENLLSTLEVGQIMELEWDEEGGAKVLKTEILEVASDNKCIIAVPFLKGRFYPLHVGKRYSFFYNKRDTGVYQFHGLILSRLQLGNQHAISVLRVSEFQKSQRRLYFRLPLVLDAVLLIADGTELEKVLVDGKLEEREYIHYREEPCIVKDLSGGGLKIQSKTPFDLETHIICAFKLGGFAFKIDGIVKRCFKTTDVVIRYDLGIAFIELDDADQAKIITYIFNRQRNLLKKGLI